MARGLGRGLTVPTIRRPPPPRSYETPRPLPPDDYSKIAFAKEVSWDDFLAFYFNWEQGEHVTLIGPTGQGKTTLALSILNLRAFVLAIATKQRDPVLYQLQARGYERVTRFGETPPEVYPRVVLAAQLPKGTESLPQQRAIVHDALTNVYIQGGWTVYLDEARYVTEYLKQAAEVELLWQQGRSSGISVVAAAQRPAWIPLSAFSQATHLFLWRTSDQRDLERVGALGAHDSTAISREVATLPRFTVLYVNTRDGTKIRTMPPFVK